MKKKIVYYIFNKINQKKKLDKKGQEKLLYYVSGLYSVITKLGLIILVSLFLGILKYTLIFLILYMPLRTFGFGWHGHSNITCWIVSSIIYLVLPYFFSIISIATDIKIIVSLINIIILFIYAPADTKKRPLIHKKRKKINKLLVCYCSFIYLLLIMFFKNNIFTNLLFGAITLQAIFVNPLTYYLTNEPYNNYKKYCKSHGLLYE